MNVRRLVGAALVTVLLPVALLACGTPASVKSVDGETYQQAARRFFPEQYELLLNHPDLANPEDAEGAIMGPPQAFCGDYQYPRLNLAKWALPDARESTTTGMFEAMRPARMSDRHYVVPMMKEGRSVAEFDVWLDDTGHWVVSFGVEDANWQRVPGGEIYNAEQAAEKLRRVLGAAAEVRTAVFLPSGWIFMVGRNGSREAAVQLGFVNAGPGVGVLDKRMPEEGQLFTTSELYELLAP